MTRKIAGPALCGFADMFEEPSSTVVGAAAKSKPKGDPRVKHKPYPKATQSKTVAQHAQALKHARKVLVQAHGKVKTAAKKTLAKPAVAVHGFEYTVIGAYSPKVKFAQAKLQAAKAKATKLAHVAAEKTKAAHATVTKLAHQIRSHENLARKMSGKAAHGVHGYVGDDGSGVDTSTTDTSTDTTDTGAPSGSQSQLDIDTLVAAANAAGKTPIDQHIADYTQVPAILYDGSKGTPDGYVGSVGLFTRSTDVGCEPDTAQIEGNAHFGYVWGRYDKSDPANGGIGWGSHLQQNAWNHVHGRFWLGDDSWHEVVDPSEAFQSSRKQVDLGLPGTHASGYQTGGQYGTAYSAQNYGPLVGNPAIAAFKGMRVDDAGNMFWLANEAPDWLTWPLKQAAALTKAAADKAQRDADAAAAAANAKAQADAAAAQAAQDAQNALDEANASSQARQAGSAAEGAAAQADADAAAAAAASAQQDVAERQFALEQARAAQAQPSGDGGGDGGGGDSGGGDEPPSPEADSDAEAAAIDSGGEGGDDTDVVGEVDALLLAHRKRDLEEDGFVGGDGEVIGIDEWGNPLE